MGSGGPGCRTFAAEAALVVALEALEAVRLALAVRLGGCRAFALRLRSALAMGLAGKVLLATAIARAAPQRPAISRVRSSRTTLSESEKMKRAGIVAFSTGAA
jgi:hypothetical protein